MALIFGWIVGFVFLCSEKGNFKNFRDFVFALEFGFLGGGDGRE